ncbi:MAG TPA: hypothetical protein VHM25_16710, partial [Polyangiaceae bacterium]|nr:hypothetical protein [Polyangiaceae bacterium]
MSRQSPLRDMAFRIGADAPRIGALVFSALLLVAFFSVPYLPMVDLPQHAAQISIWLHLNDPRWSEFQLFELNFRTPYLGVYALARGLAGVVGVLPALKVVVWLSIVGHWAAFDWLVRSLGHSRYLGLLGLPLAMGYGFYFGFISFIGALPFGLAATCLALRHRERPSLASGLWLGGALCATLATHGFALGLTVVLVAPLLLRGRGSLIARGLPLLAPAVLMMVWLMPGNSAKSIGLTLWDPRFWELSQVPGLLLASSGADHAASVLGVVFLSIVLLSLGRPSREPERFIPLAVMLLGYCLFPLSLGGFTPLHPRFAAFLVPTVLLAFQPRSSARSPYFYGLVPLATAAWFCLFAIRLQRFAHETQPISNFIAGMPAGLRIRPLIFDRGSEAFPGLPAMLHLSAYYVPEKGGYQGYSFAMYPTSVVRYHPEIVPTMDRGAEWHPEWFSAAYEAGGYQCFLVHSALDRSAELFERELDQLRLVFHEQG